MADDLLASLALAARDRALGLGSEGAAAAAERARGHRGLMAMVTAAVVAGADDADPLLEAAAGGWLGELEALQEPTGLFSSGDNLASPPDSAFTVSDGVLALTLLRRRSLWPGVGERVEAVLRRALPALVTGGVHTPNHRWEIAGALAGLGTLVDAPEALERAREWLAEGIDVDADGIYSERSPIYAAYVSNPSLLTLAAALGRDDLTDVVHANLHAQLDLTTPDGVVETVHSRRQDQKDESFPLGPFLDQLARFAAGCARCRDATRRSASAEGTDPVHATARALLDDDVRAGFAAAGHAAGAGEPGPAEAGERWFAGSRLLRRWSGDTWATVYGGSDVPASGRIASGLACNPTFLRTGLGGVGVRSARLSRDFFGLGPFRPTSAERDGDRVVLREQVSASYYQPLEAARRLDDGAYALEFEGRFAASMAFSQRRRDVVRLETEIALDLADDGVVLAITTHGLAAPHALELALPWDCAVRGADDLGDGRFHLVTGAADVVGPDAMLHVEQPTGGDPAAPPVYRPGEAYEFLGGTDALAGPRLYLTWSSPGTTTVRIRRA
ncbi:hypothetical protein L1785_15845 [Antribacter sp. KLBMP9083]|uniref:Heparinase n=1 Tax=Antribacter soli TaxID=2910976 RepID=A0AA41QGY5_9MICO|nr:hypothetical protein [Antribacter soli]MCF4122451.1 hypothetical protein [Antribacter soli]